MRQVAFFRNVNQGQRGHPSTSDLVDAVAEAGGADVAAFQSNGTVVFSSDERPGIGDRLRDIVDGRPQLDRDVVIWSAAALAEVVGRHEGSPRVERLELTLWNGTRELPDGARTTHECHRRRCGIVEQGPGWAVIRNDADRQSNGTPSVEAVLGEPATSRGLPTLIRLLRAVREAPPG